MICNKILKAVIYTIITSIISINYTNAAEIPADSTLNTSELSNGETVSFIGTSDGTLNYDGGVNTLSTISSINNGIGIIEISDINSLSITGDIGSANNKINNIDFVLPGTISFDGNIYANSITSFAYYAGSLNLQGDNSVVDALIGTDTAGLGSINIEAENITFSDDIYVGTFNVRSGKSATLSGTTNVVETLDMTDSSSALTISTGSQLDIANNTITPTMTIDGTLNIGILSTSSTDAVITSSTGDATATIADGTIINFDYSDATSISTSDTYDFISGFASGFSGSSLTISDNSILLSSSIDTTDDTKLTLSTSIDSSTTSQLNSQDYSTLNLLLNNTSISDISSIQTGLFKISDQTTLEDSLSSFQLDKSNMVQMASFDISNQVNNIIDSRISSINLGNKNKFYLLGKKKLPKSKFHFHGKHNLKVKKPAATEETFDETPDERQPDTNMGLWGNVFGNQSVQKGLDGASGYTSSGGGVVFGYDNMIKTNNHNIILGGAITYGNSFVNSDNSLSDQKTSIDSYQISLYSHVAARNGLGFYNLTSLNLGHNRYDSSRYITADSYQEKANANFSAMQYGARTAIGYNFKLGKNFILSSDVGVKYSGISLSNYTEKNAGDIGLNVKNNYFDFANSDLSLRLIGNLSSNIETQLSGKWSRKFNNRGSRAETSFIGDSDSTQQVISADILNNVYNFGAQLNIKTGKNKKVTLRYDLQRGDKFVNNTGSLQYIWEF